MVVLICWTPLIVWLSSSIRQRQGRTYFAYFKNFVWTKWIVQVRPPASPKHYVFWLDTERCAFLSLCLFWYLFLPRLVVVDRLGKRKSALCQWQHLFESKKDFLFFFLHHLFTTLLCMLHWILLLPLDTHKKKSSSYCWRRSIGSLGWLSFWCGGPLCSCATLSSQITPRLRLISMISRPVCVKRLAQPGQAWKMLTPACVDSDEFTALCPNLGTRERD